MIKKTIKVLGIRLSLVFLVLVLVLIAAATGLMLGYGVLGGGQATRVFSGNLWQDVIQRLNP
ncbi:DNA-directed RNA polymerase subunit beta [Lactococcus garvieae]|jgi:hypothetical protein|uniref:DNA-directed RNA polymerase subunit beta n=1 Tax=Lactococcus garvieae DCC43 TaxID=1231377 RepID=K2PNW1_9LACT|nr:DNA-directed RNA polymerase subunit beta [Lactococcus garvieae]EKF51949.1 hypothetical protein C426_0812 [Lactococcus garvieae DCC43]QPS71140.1 DNA-directed RNA polymerase subunit beta [Lactococcus garvieae]